MIQSSDTIAYDRLGFNNDKYLQLQRKKIVERIDKFGDGRLYLEIGGGKIHRDPHASRVLPGYLADNKKTLIKKLSNISDIIFCLNARDIKTDRQLKSTDEGYKEVSLEKLKTLEEEIDIKPKIAITLCDDENLKQSKEFRTHLEKLGYTVVFKYYISGYPKEHTKIVSENGYGKDEYLEISKPLVIVTGAASNSGKMATCLSQLYLDHQRGIKSGYAKFETFPIWILPLNHPVNLAYEAATADIGDYNVIDHHHEKEYGVRTVNYNRDVEAFDIVRSLAERIVSEDNYMRTYKSPTDMGINYAGHAITDDEAVCVASLREIKRRANWYTEIALRGDGHKDAIERCIELERKAVRYMEEKGYEITSSL